MIGIYDYTVILTYGNAVFSMVGMYLALTQHIVEAIFCLVFSGICDMFDGFVANTKERTKNEMCYGIQIDSLADLISFGVFPTVLGYASGLTQGIYLPLFVFYILAALIRLAHYNVTEMERKEQTEGCREYYEGLPVTSSAALIPLLFFIAGRMHIAITLVYPAALLIIGGLFISKVKIKKVDPRKLAFGAFVGAVVAFFVR
ncbi:CDP-diacylglycerol--serine O-phosphatidyltransferase [Enterococcus silesiacus]|uniref:CDP-diacylglycerol--serine O-phosphatidyltransferase n=1 Tax=Enterococcus silesiacus TaxID=332949 RepID=A0A0S3KEI8_9ENTE|nr:CDP-alcohol phosphatidyltransferase family protein [Enterococcus silesiacus]ALS02654.1 CDP-diacylglycerol--serine O-phosphatidyltransferase [Enterococcus silesiacus]OJG93416.1 CDP-diacylglycerol-serine O-phosphatidyltransferase [Enterococcus silesiacus]